MARKAECSKKENYYYAPSWLKNFVEVIIKCLSFISPLMRGSFYQLSTTFSPVQFTLHSLVSLTKSVYKVVKG